MSNTINDTVSNQSAHSESIEFQPLDMSVFTPEEAVALLLDRASRIRASDLFLVTNEHDVSAYVRHLGFVRLITKTGIEEGRRWMSHLKVESGIPLDARRRPSEGRWIRRRDNGTVTDLRINTLPTLYGEDISIRLLERESDLRTLDSLGMLPRQMHELIAMINSPGGLVLVTGPTVSGKTTTLYACLQNLNNGSRKINTIEDPVEYAVAGLRQSQVNPLLEIDFPEMLRSVLRQAPDVIMVGEIRDPLTAQTAVRAANSGHVVLATLHAPIAAGAIQSMLSLDVHPHFFSSCLRGVVTQRLVRTLCPECKCGYDISESPLTFEEVHGFLEPGQGDKLYSSVGCDACMHEGYTDRTGVFEVLNATPRIRKLISEERPAREIQQQAISDGMIEFRRAGMIKVAQGVTTIEEMLRVVPAEFLGIDED